MTVFLGIYGVLIIVWLNNEFQQAIFIKIFKLASVRNTLDLTIYVT